MKYKTRKKPYLKMSLDQLKIILKKTKEDINKNKIEIKDYSEKYEEYQKKNQKFLITRKKISKIYKDAYNRLPPFRKFFIEESDVKLNKLEREKVKSFSNIWIIEQWLNDNIGIESYYKLLIKEKEKLEIRKKRVLYSMEVVSKRKERKEKDRAIIASYKNKSREVANNIKRDLKNKLNCSDCCPYCSREIGEVPHCDHIYPVSRGGLSTTENMIYICSDCNKKKNDLTLREFILKFNLNREEIEETLKKLKKRF
jgi:5-methylcytosine-specific restriction endonuclease McrA